MPTAGAKSSIWEGRAYYFCSEDCRTKFEAAPRTYAATYPSLIRELLEMAKIPSASAHAAPHLIPVLALGLSLFLAISYTFCIAGYVLLPALPIRHSALAIFLPGFELLSWQAFFIGLVESLGWGWYIALIFGPLYNFFASRR